MAFCHMWCLWMWWLGRVLVDGALWVPLQSYVLYLRCILTVSGFCILDVFLQCQGSVSWMYPYSVRVLYLRCIITVSGSCILDVSLQCQGPVS